MNTIVCCFNGCKNPSLPHYNKCDFHRNRLFCTFPNCNNQVYARGLCVRHGGKKPCSVDGCFSNARTGGVCSRHSLINTKKKCSELNCTSMAHANRRCVRHGGGRYCKIDGCTTLARMAGYCQRHSKSAFTNELLSVEPEIPPLPSLEVLDEDILDCVLRSTSPKPLTSARNAFKH